MDASRERLKVIFYATLIVVAVAVVIGLVFLVIRDSRQQSHRRVALYDQPSVVAAGEVPRRIDASLRCELTTLRRQMTVADRSHRL
jgi:hypothetical protein